MNPPPTSLPTTSLWVIPVHQLQARILGLNYPNISFSVAIPIVDNLKNEGAISELVFAFFLSK